MRIRNLLTALAPLALSATLAAQPVMAATHHHHHCNCKHSKGKKPQHKHHHTAKPKKAT